MKSAQSGEEQTTYVDTPKGIFSATGVWFRTTEAMVEAYAEPVLEREPLARLIHSAEVWLRSPEILSLWALPILLLNVSPLTAALATLTLYLGWRGAAPGLVSRALGGVFGVLDKVWLQGLYYILTLSVLGMIGAYPALVVGLVGFIVLRWGLLRRVTEPLMERLWGLLFRLPVADQVLRSVIIRTALKYRVSLPEIDRLEAQILDTWNYKKKK